MLQQSHFDIFKELQHPSDGVPCKCQDESLKAFRQKEEYCGFCCSDVKDALERMLWDLNQLHDINPEFAIQFADDMTTMILRAKSHMLGKEDGKPHRRETAAELH